MPKHLCPRCGAFIRWALQFCFDCNKLIDPASLPQENGQPLYPIA